MDKYEYKLRLEEIKSLNKKGRFQESAQVADTIDWKKVRNTSTLGIISDVYKINRRFDDAKEILLLANEKSPQNRRIIYALCDLTVKMGQVVEAVEYYKEFVQLAPNDNSKYILLYKIYEAQDISLEERIAVLKEYKKREYSEKWAYELAFLYHRVGLATECVEECDQLILWFGEGKYVLKAMELKRLYVALSPAQQQLYDRQYGRQAEPEETQKKPAEEQAAQGEDLDFEVKPMDMGQYNTINLQAALAESMKEVLGHDKKEQESAAFDEQAADQLRQVSAAAPTALQHSYGGDDTEYQEDVSRFLRDSDDWDVQATGQLDTDETEKAVSSAYDGVSAAALESRRMVMAQMQRGSAAALEEPVPEQEERVAEPAITVAAAPAEQPAAEPVQTEAFSERREPVLERTEAQPAFAERREPAPTRTKEYQEPIKLERQTTGQMNIEAVLEEWERLKKENEEKRKQETRQWMLQQTGSLFADFDQSSRNGVLEMLQREESLPVETMQREKMEDASRISEVEELEEIAEPDTEESVEQDMVPEISVQTAAVSDVAAEAETAKAVYEAERQTAPEEEVQQEQPVEEAPLQYEPEVQKETKKAAKVVAGVDFSSAREQAVRQQAQGSVRGMTKEEKKLFAPFVHTKKAMRQLVTALDAVSLSAYTGNMIITGAPGSNMMKLAKNVIREIRAMDDNFSGRVAKVTADTINQKDAASIVAQVANGALIIEKAGKLSGEGAENLVKALNQEHTGIIVFALDEKRAMDRLFDRAPELMDMFTARFDIVALDSATLVKYGCQYAYNQEYSIDELGRLALHTRIEDMQTSTHAVTVKEVREIVDEAIEHANRKTLRHFMDILFRKRYDEDDMIVLRERDFI
ncbi:MAG: hypothetical protein ACLT5Z_01695 [Eisenbergiella sp.]